MDATPEEGRIFCCHTFGDNEGLLSTIAADGTALIGVMTSYWIRSPR